MYDYSIRQNDKNNFCICTLHVFSICFTCPYNVYFIMFIFFYLHTVLSHTFSFFSTLYNLSRFHLEFIWSKSFRSRVKCNYFYIIFVLNLIIQIRSLFVINSHVFIHLLFYITFIFEIFSYRLLLRLNE